MPLQRDCNIIQVRAALILATSSESPAYDAFLLLSNVLDVVICSQVG